MLREIPCFRQPNVHTVLIVNIFKCMTFLHMQESIRGDRRQEEKPAKEVQVARNYQVSRDFNPNDPSQPISAITHTLPGPRYNLVSKGATQVRNTLEDCCIQTAMEVCAPLFDPVIVVEVAF